MDEIEERQAHLAKWDEGLIGLASDSIGFMWGYQTAYEYALKLYDDLPVATKDAVCPMMVKFWEKTVEEIENRKKVGDIYRNVRP